jgi:hypothetical protein
MAGIAYFDKYIQPSDDSCVGSILTNVINLLFRNNCMEIGIFKICGEYWVFRMKLGIHNLLYLIYKSNKLWFLIVGNIINKMKLSLKKHIKELHF